MGWLSFHLHLLSAEFPFSKRTEKRELIQQFRLLLYYKEKKDSKTKISAEYFTCKLLDDAYKQRSKEGRETRRHGWLYPSNSGNCASVCREIGSFSQTWWCELQLRLEHVWHVPELQSGGFSGLWYDRSGQGPVPKCCAEFHEESASVTGSGSGSGSTRLLINPEAEHPQRNTNTPHTTQNGSALYLLFKLQNVCLLYQSWKILSQIKRKINIIIFPIPKSNRCWNPGPASFSPTCMYVYVRLHASQMSARISQPLRERLNPAAYSLEVQSLPHCFWKFQGSRVLRVTSISKHLFLQPF